MKGETIFSKLAKLLNHSGSKAAMIKKGQQEYQALKKYFQGNMSPVQLYEYLKYHTERPTSQNQNLNTNQNLKQKKDVPINQ